MEKMCIKCGKELRNNFVFLNGTKLIYFDCKNRKCERYGLITTIWNVTIFKTASCGISETVIVEESKTLAAGCGLDVNIINKKIEMEFLEYIEDLKCKAFRILLVPGEYA